MRNITFTSGGVYHVYNRGVEKRKIFMDNQDKFRFVHDLFEFNDEEPALNLYYKKTSFQSHDPQSQSYESYETKFHKIERQKRKLVVEILAFVLMPNHFHLLVKQKKENGIPAFMHKLGVGYTNYFNQKCQRTGGLFQGTYKALEVKSDAHFIHIPYYIHLNPLDLIMPEWREKEIKDYRKAMKFLENYRWSSFPDYIGKKNFPSVTQRDFLLEFFGGPKQYKKDITKWLKEMDLEEINKFSKLYEI